MNRSGEAAAEVLRRFETLVEMCLIVVDDFNLPLGTLRFRRGGSDGGHNGLKSIIAAVGSSFPRLRVGIGPLPARQSVIDFVLTPFDDTEKQSVDSMVRSASEAVQYFCVHGIEKAMNTYNSTASS